MKNTKVQVSGDDEWKVKEQLVLKKEKVYMLKNEELKVDIIWLHHTVLVVGHRE